MLNPRITVGKLALRISQLIHPFRLKKASWGNDYPNKQFLIIRCRGYGRGLFSFFYTSLGWIAYARRNGMIPVVDMKHYPTIYHPKGVKPRANIWETFFSQPGGYSLEEISHAKTVIITDALEHPGEQGFLPSIGNAEDIETHYPLRQWRNLVKEVISVNSEAISHLSVPAFEEADKSTTLGVLARGTDYSTIKPSGHPIQPGIDLLFEAIDSYLRQRNATRIFLVTEDSTIADAFKKKYPNQLILSNQECANYSGGYLVRSDNVAGNLSRGFAYLKAIVDLSRCGSIIAGRTSGSIGAILLSSGFSYSKIFNLGLYP